MMPDLIKNKKKSQKNNKQMLRLDTKDRTINQITNQTIDQFIDQSID